MPARLPTLLASTLLLIFSATLAWGESSEPVQELQAIIDSAQPGSEIVLKPGTYLGPAVINKPLTITGEGYPIIDGRGIGDVILIKANNVTITGLKIINSSPHISLESAGVKVRGNNCRIIGNIIMDTLFGVYLLGSYDTLIERNTIVGFPFKDINERGHGIYLWYTFDTAIYNNYIVSVKDGIYNEHAYGTRIVDNRITSSRYAIHLMYSWHYEILNNTVEYNLVGIALMYSYNIRVAHNVLKENRGMAVGEGIFIKENGNHTIENNLIYGSIEGIVIEGSPRPANTYQIIRNNTIAFNQIGISIDSTSGGLIYANNIIENIEQIRLVGATEPRVSWSYNGVGNYWSDYNGFDLDGDGIGDLPHRYEDPLEDIMDGFPQLRILIHSPAYQALETMKKAFPLHPRIKAVDEAPLTRPSQTFKTYLRGEPAWLVTASILTFIPLATIVSVVLRGAKVGGDRRS